MNLQLLAAEEEIDRSPPIAILLSAESFLKSAQHLRNGTVSGNLKLRFEMPVYYLYSHAIELALKSFLRTKGFDMKQLSSRKYGHQLNVLWDECLKHGLKLHPIRRDCTEQLIELLDPFATRYEFRYVITGFKQLPQLHAVDAEVTSLIASVKLDVETHLRQGNSVTP
ncbi:hypothetical protein SR870_16485 [Rhodopseudomonas palustris]|uniref:hypothetical protein n=1 Tax=Rhodopseudomonas palustris TaxID=1076 RepID=UPI002ACD8733|nr:hypothetical protein [Rhodopseudomonas palustris]WQG98293.1 hypothetical protein SR870_16485 [Rhodopseudomonas palustris]